MVVQEKQDVSEGFYVSMGLTRPHVETIDRIIGPDDYFERSTERSGIFCDPISCQSNTDAI